MLFRKNSFIYVKIMIFFYTAFLTKCLFLYKFYDNINSHFAIFVQIKVYCAFKPRIRNVARFIDH